MDVVAEFTLGDGPWLLMVPLECSYLGPHDRGAAISVIVHAPVVDTSQEVCTHPMRMHEFLLWIWYDQHKYHTEAI